ncbi:MAG: hypothetical protein AB7Q37_14210 [Pyrinomonadaceae bacterium]
MNRNALYLLSFTICLAALGCGSSETRPNVRSNVPNGTGGNEAQTAANVMNNTSAAEAAKASPFNKTVEMHGIKFTVESPNSAVDNFVKVTPAGLTITNEPFTAKIAGEVVAAEVGDLNVDSSPEVFVFYKETAGMKRARVLAYSANAKKSLSEVNMPEPDPASKEYAGYRGEDEMTVIENVLSHRFPVYDGSGPDAKKTGKTRIVQFKIKPGEAAWQFYVHRSDEY